MTSNEALILLGRMLERYSHPNGIEFTAAADELMMTISARRGELICNKSISFDLLAAALAPASYLMLLFRTLQEDMDRARAKQFQEDIAKLREGVAA